MLLAVGPLPDDPIAAAAAFHGEWVPRVLAALDAGEAVVTLLFAPASHVHAGWREAAVQLLARERTPARINAIAGDDPGGIAATAAFIAGAPGFTGQYCVLDGMGAGEVVASTP
jgi:hypothetical protein